MASGSLNSVASAGQFRASSNHASFSISENDVATMRSQFFPLWKYNLPRSFDALPLAEAMRACFDGTAFIYNGGVFPRSHGGWAKVYSDRSATCLSQLEFGHTACATLWRASATSLWPLGRRFVSIVLAFGGTGPVRSQ